MRERGIPLSIGSDSNVRLDPLEELRELEGIARRQAMRRNVIPVPTTSSRSDRPKAPVRSGSTSGRRSTIDVEHRSLAGVPREEVEAALVFGCGADVLAG